MCCLLQLFLICPFFAQFLETVKVIQIDSKSFTYGHTDNSLGRGKWIFLLICGPRPNLRTSPAAWAAPSLLTFFTLSHTVLLLLHKTWQQLFFYDFKMRSKTIRWGQTCSLISFCISVDEKRKTNKQETLTCLTDPMGNKMFPVFV